MKLTIFKALLFIFLIVCGTCQAQVLKEVNLVREGRYVVTAPDTITAHNEQREAIQAWLNALLRGNDADSISMIVPTFRMEPVYDPFKISKSLLLYDFHLKYSMTLSDSVQHVVLEGYSSAEFLQVIYSGVTSDTLTMSPATDQNFFISDTLRLHMDGTLYVNATASRGGTTHSWSDSLNTNLIKSVQ